RRAGAGQGRGAGRLLRPRRALAAGDPGRVPAGRGDRAGGTDPDAVHPPYGRGVRRRRRGAAGGRDRATVRRRGAADAVRRGEPAPMTLDASPRAANLSASKKALLAQRLRQRATGEARRIPRRPAGDPPPMSYAQERLWFMEQFAPGTAAYNIPFVRRLRGDLRVDLLRRAFDEIVARHETLRTRYPATDDGRPVQVVDLPAVADVREVDAADLDEAGRLVNEAAAVPFDVTGGPLLPVLLVRVAPDDHVLLVVTHHSISDGWSTEVLI